MHCINNLQPNPSRIENKIDLTPKITQNCPVRRIYLTLQVLFVCPNFPIVLLDEWPKKKFVLLDGFSAKLYC